MEEPVTPGDVPSEATAGRRIRPVRSYVLRGGRVTPGQQRALDECWPVWGIEPGGKLDLVSLFGNAQPIIVEVGFGNGDSTWQMAREHPEENFLGIEVHRPGVGHLLMKLKEHDVRNVRIACADAVEFLGDRLPESSLAGVRVYFPDPWPKKRHHKRRLVQPEFIALVARALRPGGVLHLSTDWTPYAEHMLAVLAANDEFTNLSADGTYCPRPPWRPPTRYEKRGQQLGHAVHDLIFRRVEASNPRRPVVRDSHGGRG